MSDLFPRGALKKERVYKISGVNEEGTSRSCFCQACLQLSKVACLTTIIFLTAISCPLYSSKSAHFCVVKRNQQFII